MNPANDTEYGSDRCMSDGQDSSDWSCREWRERLRVRMENEYLLEQIVGSPNPGSRANLQVELDAYNARCGGCTGPLQTGPSSR